MSELKCTLTRPIPTDVYYLADADNFYDMRAQVGMGHGFWRKWRRSRDYFPQSREAALLAALDAQARLIEEAREVLTVTKALKYGLPKWLAAKIDAFLTTLPASTGERT